MCYVWKIQSASEPNTLQPVTSFQAHPKYITRCLLSPDTKSVGVVHIRNLLIRFFPLGVPVYLVGSDATYLVVWTDLWDL